VAIAPGGYRVEQILSQGPHGRVYRARTAQGQVVALKELQFAAVPEVQQVDAFEREARTLEALHHPAIPRFIQSFQEGTGVHLRLYLAFEFIEGESLAARIAREGPLPEGALFNLAEQAVAVLTYLHGRASPVLHRDIKPDNILLRPDGKLVLVDFGSARRLGGSRTHGSTLVGTYGYMPPEQLGGTVDVTSDLYALGATLLHAATGKAPADLVGPHLALRIPGNVPSALRLVLEGVLQLDPAQRFPNARAFAAALAAAQGGQLSFTPSERAPPRPPASPGRFVALVAVVALAGVGMFAATARRSTALAASTALPAFASRASPATARGWFAGAKSSCNPVEVSQFMARQPPPAGTEGAGLGAGCYALAGKMLNAQALIDGLPTSAERGRAAEIVFELGHPVADSGDDVAASPIMHLVLKYTPSNFMALYHAGASDDALGNTELARQELQRFLELYSVNDNFRQNAIRILERTGGYLRR